MMKALEGGDSMVARECEIGWREPPHQQRERRGSWRVSSVRAHTGTPALQNYEKKKSHDLVDIIGL